VPAFIKLCKNKELLEVRKFAGYFLNKNLSKVRKKLRSTVQLLAHSSTAHGLYGSWPCTHTVIHI
jgi:hypothetical protein